VYVCYVGVCVCALLCVVCVYVCMCVRAPVCGVCVYVCARVDAHLVITRTFGHILRILGFQEFINPGSAPSESEQSTSKTGAPKMGPKTQNRDFIDNGSNNSV
jgi:hypothetical protein